MRWFDRLFFWRTSVDRASFAPTGGDEVDPRTEVIPLAGGYTGKTYYEVADMWARERLSTRRILLEILDGKRGLQDAHEIPADFQCDIGVWMRFVQPGAETQRALDDLRIWHAQWHDATNQIIDSMSAGDFGYASRSLSTRSGPWYYAARKVDRHLEELWAKKTL